MEHSDNRTAQTTTVTAEGKQVLVLKLKDDEKKPTVTWTEDTVNNEHMGRKSSKSKFPIMCYPCMKSQETSLTSHLIYCWVALLLFTGCCIFHKSKAFGESDSDESDSDTEIAKSQPPKPGQPPAFQRHHA